MNTSCQDNKDETRTLLKALVVVPNDRTKEFGSLLAVARAEARKREHADKNPAIRSLLFVPELGVYVAIYEVSEAQTNKAEVKGQIGSVS